MSEPKCPTKTNKIYVFGLFLQGSDYDHSFFIVALLTMVKKKSVVDLMNICCLVNGFMQASISMAPVNIFKHGADEEKAETARLVSFFSVFFLNIYIYHPFICNKFKMSF